MKKIAVILMIVGMLALSACTQNEQPPVTDQSQPGDNSSQDAVVLSVDEAPYMQLKIEGYREQYIQDFDEAFSPFQDDFSGYGQNDPDTDFKRTLLFSKMQLLYDGNGETPLYSVSSATAAGQLSFEICWTIADQTETTVGQRDDLINLAEERMVAAADEIGEGSDDAISALQAAADEIAEQLTADWVTVEIIIESIG